MNMRPGVNVVFTENKVKADVFSIRMQAFNMSYVCLSTSVLQRVQIELGGFSWLVRKLRYSRLFQSSCRKNCFFFVHCFLAIQPIYNVADEKVEIS